jgi:hypothetical membrane protein
MVNAIRVGAISGILTPIVAFTCITLAIGFYPPFSWTTNALSDLGIVEGTTSVLFNGGLILAGILGFMFAVLGLFSFTGKTLAGKVGSALLAGSTVALVSIGIFNENFVPIHYLVSVAFFISAPISLFILTYAFYLGKRQSLAAYTLLTGVVAAAPWILQFTLHYVPNVAIPETISGVAVSLWVITLAAKMLKVKV